MPVGDTTGDGSTSRAPRRTTARSSSSPTTGGGDTYPTVDQFDAWVAAECIAKDFPAYTGTSYDDRDDINVAFFYPPEDAGRTASGR